MSRKQGNSITEDMDEKEAVRMQEKEYKRTIFSFFIRLIVFIAIIWAAFTFLFGIAQVNGESMYPRVRDGDLIFYYRLNQDYALDDVVTFKINGYRRVARVVAKGGDVVDINADGELVVNGYPQEEEIFYLTEKTSTDIAYPYTVPEDSYFVLCDFRTNSYDSRNYGAISGSDIDGKIFTLLRRRGF
jgi:signal peptidase I